MGPLLVLFVARWCPDQKFVSRLSIESFILIVGSERRKHCGNLFRIVLDLIAAHFVAEIGVASFRISTLYWRVAVLHRNAAFALVVARPL